MNLQTLKVVRDAWINKGRTYLVVLTIAISIFSMGSLARVWYILSNNISDTYMATNPSSAIISTLGTFDSGLVNRVSRNDDIEYVVGSNIAYGRLKVGPNNWRILKLVKVSDFENMKINLIESESGVWPPRNNMVVLERSSLDALPFGLNEAFTVKFGNQDEQAVELVGSVHDLTQLSSAFSLVIYGYVNEDTFEDLTGQRDFNYLEFTVAEDRFNEAHIADVVDDVVQVMESNGQIVIRKNIPTPGKHVLDNIVQSVLLLLLVLSLLGMFLAVFLVINIISAQLSQQTQQIGTIKAVGGVSTQILAMYFQSVGLFGLIALVVTIPLSIGFSRWSTVYFAKLINFDIVDFSVPLQYFFIEFFAGIILPFLAALYPILKAARLTVRESLGFSGGQDVQFGTSGFEKLLSNIPNLPSIILYPFRNIFRRKVRLALSAITLCVAGAIWISVSSVQKSFEVTVDEVSDYWQEDVKINLRGMQNFKKTEAIVMQASGVSYVEPRLVFNAFRAFPDGTESIELVQLTGVDPISPFIQPHLIEGRWLLPDDTNAIVANIDLLTVDPNLKLGDEIVFRTGRQKIAWIVVGITTSQVVGGSDALMSPIGYVNYTYLAKVTRLPGMTGSILIDLDGKNVDSAVTDLEILLAQRNVGISGILKKSEVRGALDDSFSILLIVLQITSLLFGFVGGLGLTSMMSLNVLERTREIGIIRSVGGVRSQLSQIIVIEGIFVGIMSWLLAVILAYPMSIMLGNSIGQTLLNTKLEHVFPMSGPLTWLGIVVVLSVVSSLIPGRNASKLTVRETISFE